MVLSQFQHGKENLIGILLTNIGSPEAPTPSAVRKYLAQFLSDPRIIDWPRWLWLPILYSIVLVFRPRRSARLYKNIWDNGSPLIKIMEQQQAQLEALLAEQGYANLVFALGMRYGKPSIARALQDFRDRGVRKILIFPLFPQFSLTTTASTYDAVFDELKTWDWLPELHFISDYHDHLAYIQALVSSISEAWQTQGEPEKLMFSYHGVPKRYLAQTDDPYERQCQKTASLVAEQLGLLDGTWQISFQSRFGPEEWVQPYTDETLEQWGHDKLESLHAVCPGFSADCLETIDEIDREGREEFENAGGGDFYYIPALNNRQDHIQALSQIIISNLRSWQEENHTQAYNGQPKKALVS